ncbi:MAG: phytanoyl-CoA dioxygenase family protein [Planctomycetes bacterium]|nr:phytanoyl-CoA dioxygenase family protein [Planctomycetota bacterium]
MIDHERHRDELRIHGHTVLRRILPTTLVTDLRRVADQARDRARAQHGPQAQRLQPLIGQGLDERVLNDYVTLPALVDAIAAILGPQHAPSAGLGINGILFEPAETPWCTAWHRDWIHHGIDPALWRPVFSAPDHFVQVNCALYDDDCTWVVPGSHLRPDDRADETAAAVMPAESDDPVTREQTHLDYCRGMPGAAQLILGPGDYALYRSSLWHLGRYVPYRRRATLHDSPDTPAWRAWCEARKDEARKRAAAA